MKINAKRLLTGCALAVVVLGVGRLGWLHYNWLQIIRPVEAADGSYSVLPGYPSGPSDIDLSVAGTGRIPDQELVHAIEAQQRSATIEYLDLGGQRISHEVAQAAAKLPVRLFLSGCLLAPGSADLLVDARSRIHEIYCDEALRDQIEHAAKAAASGIKVTVSPFQYGSVSDWIKDP